MLTLEVRARANAQEVRTRRGFQARHETKALEETPEGIVAHRKEALVPQALFPLKMRRGGTQSGPHEHLVNGLIPMFEGILVQSFDGEKVGCVK